nr:chloroplast protein import component Tic20-IV [Passiflora tenuiloba]
MPGVAAVVAAPTTSAQLLKTPSLDRGVFASKTASNNLLKHPSPFLALAAFTAYRRKVIADRCNKFLRAHQPSSSRSGVECEPGISMFPRLSLRASSCGPHQQLHAFSSKEKPFSHLFSDSTSLFGGTRDSLSNGFLKLHKRQTSMKPPNAIKHEIFGFRYPVLDVKPEWWWRTLSCIPYLFALQISEIAAYMQPFLDKLDLFSTIAGFIPGAYSRVPQWFIIAYFYVVYFRLARNKDVPHFLRFHLAMGLLLENAMQAFWVVSNFFPLIHYNGTFGAYYWFGAALAYVLLMLYCILHALAGSYVELPIISESAYIHTLFNVGGSQRPF